MLEPDDGDVLDVSLFPFRFKLVVDLTAAVDDLLDLIVSNEICGGILKDPFEPKPGFKVAQRASSTTELEKLLGDGYNQRLPEGPPDLASQQMEVLGCSRAVTESEVHTRGNFGLGHLVTGRLIVSVSQLEEALDAA